MKKTARFALLLLALSATLHRTEAQRRRTCELSDEITHLYFDSARKTFVVIDYERGPNSYGNIESHLAKTCKCGSAPTSYCLIRNNENHCSVRGDGSSSSDEAPRCFQLTMFYALKQMFWTPVYFSLFVLFVALFTTRCGKFARNYVLGKCCPCFAKQANRRLVDRILAREREAREEFRRVWEEARSRPDGMREQIYLKLKTKKLDVVPVAVSSSNSSNGGDGDGDGDGDANLNGDANPDGDTLKTPAAKEIEDGSSGYEEITCSICMVDLKNGERVGDLPCGHHFHVECLKTWVLWRNVCPLCNAQDIAQTHTKLVPRDDANANGDGGIDSGEEGFDDDRGNSSGSGGTGRRPVFGRISTFFRTSSSAPGTRES